MHLHVEWYDGLQESNSFQISAAPSLGLALLAWSEMTAGAPTIKLMFQAAGRSRDRKKGIFLPFQRHYMEASYFTGETLVTWPHIVARESGRHCHSVPSQNSWFS